MYIDRNERQYLASYISQWRMLGRQCWYNGNNSAKWCVRMKFIFGLCKCASATNKPSHWKKISAKIESDIKYKHRAYLLLMKAVLRKLSRISWKISPSLISSILGSLALMTATRYHQRYILHLWASNQPYLYSDSTRNFAQRALAISSVLVGNRGIYGSNERKRAELKMKDN